LVFRSRTKREIEGGRLLLRPEPEFATSPEFVGRSPVGGAAGAAAGAETLNAGRLDLAER
jgi:hypothetical protein